MIGQAGRYNPTDLDIVSQLNANGTALLQHILGSDWTELKYFKEVEKNDFYSNDKQFGIRATSDSELETLISTEEVEVTFEIKLTKEFQNRDGDEAERAVELELIQELEKIRRAIWHSNLGNYQQVVNVRNIDRDECEKIGDNIILGRMTVVVNYAVINSGI